MADVEKLKFGTTTYDIKDASAARDNSVVHITGAETITGAKTFSNNTTILNSGANTGYIGLNLSSSGSSISLKKQSGSDTVTPVNITSNALSQYYGTSQTPYIIQLGTHGGSTDNVKILSDGNINIKNTLNINNDGLYSDSTITIRSDGGDIELHTDGGSIVIDGQTNIDNDLYVYGESHLDSIYPYQPGDDLLIHTGLWVENDIDVDGSLTTNGIYTSSSISINAPGADIIIPTDGTDGNIAIVPTFSTSKAYAVGDYVIYGRRLLECTTAHSASAWNQSHFTNCTNKIVSVDDIIGKTFEATGSDYAEKFETLEDCPACRFVTLDGEKIKLAQPEDDYILGITSELPSIIGDKMNQGTPVGLLGKLWVECDNTVKVNSFVTSGKDGIATKSDKGYRVMAVDGNKCKVLVK